MKKHSLLCLPQDYDFYSILLPLHGVIKKWRDKYLYSELVKRHPCFSDSCCYDSHLRFSKKGFFADVVVMQKFRLAEYKNENHRKPIYIEERKRSVFFREKMPFPVYLGAALVFAFFIGFLLVKGAEIKASRGAVIMDLQTSKAHDPEQDEPQPLTQSTTARFLLLAAQNSAQLYSFSWQTEGFTERFSAGIKNVYPHVFLREYPQATFSVVSYENEIPSFSVEIIQKLQNQKVSAGLIPEAFVLELRTMLKENGAAILEEAVNPYGIKILVPQDKNQIEIIKKLFLQIAQSELILQSFSVAHTGQGLCISVYFAVQGVGFSKQFCEALINNAQVFALKNKPVVPVPAAHEKKNAAVQKASATRLQEIPIGKLIKKDGTVIQFFKDEKGKITGR